MGLTFDLTLPHGPITPFYVKALSDGLVALKNGVINALTTSSGTLDPLKYFEYDASYTIASDADGISQTGIDTELQVNYNDRFKAGQRLIAFYISSLANRTHCLFTNDLNANNFETCYIDIAAGVATLYYYVKVGGVAIYNMSVVITGALTVGWHVIQVHNSNNAANTFPCTTLLLDGTVVSGPTNDATATAIAFAATTLKLGYGRNSAYTAIFSRINIDTFLIRKGLLFSTNYTDQPTDPSWDIKSYNSGQIVERDIGAFQEIAPSLYPENTPPQGIPDFCVYRDVCYITGLARNKKVVALVPGTYGGVDYRGSTLNEPLGTYINGVWYGGQLAAGTSPGGSWYYAISYFDTRTGQESPVSLWEGVNNGAIAGPNPNVPLAPGGGQKVVLGIYASNNASLSNFNRYKIYRKDSVTGAIYYVGMKTPNVAPSISTLPTLSFDDIYPTVMSYSFTGFESCFFVKNIGLEPPTSLTLGAAGAGSLPVGASYNAGITYVDYYTGVRSPLFINQTTFALGAGSSKTITGGTVPSTLEADNICALGWLRNNSAGEQSFYNAVSGVTVADIYQEYPPTVAMILSAYSGLTIEDTTLAIPPACNYVKAFADRLWYACDKYKNRIYFSETDQLELVGGNSYIVIGNDDSEGITGIYPFAGTLVIFKEKSTWILTGNDPSNFQVIDISLEVGCSAHRTIVAVQNFLFFANLDGAYIYDGARILPISGEIRDIFKGMDIRSRPLMTAAVDTEKGFIFLALRQAASMTVGTTQKYNYNNDTILIYNYVESFKDLKHRWTVAPLDTSCLSQGQVDFTRLNKVVFSNLIPNSGANPMAAGSGFGFFDPVTNKDFGNYSAQGFNWEWRNSPITVKIGFNQRHKWLNGLVSADDCTVNTSISFGYRIGSVETLTAYTVAPGSEKLQKKVFERSKYIQPVMKGTNSTERFVILGFQMFSESVGIR